jgi:hypothetical protein
MYARSDTREAIERRPAPKRHGPPEALSRALIRAGVLWALL